MLSDLVQTTEIILGIFGADLPSLACKASQLTCVLFGEAVTTFRDGGTAAPRFT